MNISFLAMLGVHKNSPHKEFLNNF